MAIKKIAIGKLQTGMIIANPIYVKKNNKNILLMSENTLIVSENQLGRLINAGITSVEIDTDKGTDTFHSLLDQQKWDELIKSAKNKGATEALITKHLNNFSTTLTGIIAKNVYSRMYIGEERVVFVLKEIISKIHNNIDILMAFIRLMSINEYSYAQSVNATVMCTSIANQLGFSFNDLIRFGTGTLIADLGMTSFHSSILRRPSGITKKEREEIQKHPIYTVDFLKKNNIDDHLIETVVIQHHERFDGSGYPYGLKGDEIHNISKLFAVVDVFIAMTSPRPHRTGLPPHMALAEILKMSGTLYDPKVSKIFIKHVGVFPVGNMVELSSERIALVASPSKSEPLRPVVILFKTKKKLSIPGKAKNSAEDKYTISRGQWQLVDLAKDGKEFGQIKRGLDHRIFSINPYSFLDQI